MTIRIFANLSEGEHLTLSLNDQIAVVDADAPTATFSVDGPQQCRITVEREAATGDRGWRSWLFFCLTAIFRGIFALFISWAEDAKWYERITPLCFRATWVVDAQSDTDLQLFYKRSRYDEVAATWLRPALTVHAGEIAEMECRENTEDFVGQYVNYAKRLISAALVVTLLFAIPAVVAAVRHNVAAAIILGAIVVLLVAMVTATILVQRRKLHRVRASFAEQYTGE